jgi:putative molybdopterin biosynthesis protein
MLDEETGQYNIPYVRRALGGREVVMVNLVYWEQGLMVPSGNPKGIRSLADMTRDGVSFVNRQRGSGTRMLLDYELKRAAIDADAISGYDLDECTPMRGWPRPWQVAPSTWDWASWPRLGHWPWTSFPF